MRSDSETPPRALALVLQYYVYDYYQAATEYSMAALSKYLQYYLI